MSLQAAANTTFDLMADLAQDPANAWSIGSFGAIGEFVRTASEPTEVRREPGVIEIVTQRGALRVAPAMKLAPIAWDSLSSDGESWKHALAFCCPRPQSDRRSIRSLGADSKAIRPADRSHLLFDLGVSAGSVTMAIRTSDPRLAEMIEARVGAEFLACSELLQEVLRAQPHRVLLSPAGRIEVYQPIPPADGKSPVGPHTHLLANLASRYRPHASNVPIPADLQAAIMCHPPSPWHDALGQRQSFVPSIDAKFAPLLRKFELSGDREAEHLVRTAILNGSGPETIDWPQTRRGRTKARIVLRRMTAAGVALSRGSSPDRLARGTEMS